GIAVDRGGQRVTHVAGDLVGTRTGGRGQVACDVLARQHRAGGAVDRRQDLHVARQGRAFTTQYATVEVEFDVAECLGQIGRHRIADVEPQVGFPLVRLEAGDQTVELREQVRIGQRDAVVGDPLRLQEFGQL